jgi:Trypsin-co-occurring domain 2
MIEADVAMVRSGVVVDISQEPVPLADFIFALRDQLRVAHAERDPAFPIEVGPISVEFTLLTRREGEGRAGVKFWVVDAGVSGKLAAESTQKVTLQLTPLDLAGGKLRVSDQEVRQGGSPGESQAARTGRADYEQRR